jgi:hypothetical protein
MPTLLIEKYTGELVPFEPQILKNSLAKSGASENEVEAVFKKVIHRLVSGMTTREIYQIAFDELRSIRKSYAARYNLKKALRDLGPEGYYFEAWIARLFNQKKCQTLQGVTLQGHAVSHEIDVVAVNDNELHLGECKFKNDSNAKTPVTTPMYFLSRFNDLKNIAFEFFGKKMQPTHPWIFTNAHFSSDAIEFSEYYGINLMAWNYPPGNSIKERVDRIALYPITCLTSLTAHQTQQLLKSGIVLVKELIDNRKVFELLQVSPAIEEEILLEAQELVGITSQVSH